PIASRPGVAARTRLFRIASKRVAPIDLEQAAARSRTIWVCQFGKGYPCTIERSCSPSPWLPRSRPRAHSQPPQSMPNIMTAAHLDALRKLRTSFDPLYAALTPDQKKTADSLMIGPMGVMGVGMM